MNIIRNRLTGKIAIAKRCDYYWLAWWFLSPIQMGLFMEVYRNGLRKVIFKPYLRIDFRPNLYADDLEVFDVLL